MAAFTGNVNINEAVSTFVTLKECAMDTTGPLRIGAISIDGSTTTIGWEWKIEKKVDGTNYRIIASGAVAAGLSKEILTGHTETTKDYKISVKSAGGGADPKTLYYEIPYGPQDDIEAMASIFTVLGKIDDNGYLEVNVKYWWDSDTDPIINIDSLIDDIKAVTDALTAAKATLLASAIQSDAVNGGTIKADLVRMSGTPTDANDKATVLKGALDHWAGGQDMIHSDIWAISNSLDKLSTLATAIDDVNGTLDVNLEGIYDQPSAAQWLYEALESLGGGNSYIKAKIVNKLSTVGFSTQEKADLAASTPIANLIANLKEVMKSLNRSRKGRIK